jgi:large subunit ribosomal protein L54
MICRTCLRRAAIIPRLSSTSFATSRALSTTLRVRSAAPQAQPTPADSLPPSLKPLEDSTLVDNATAKPVLSSCPAGTPLNGLNYFKNKSDPVALPDEEYPEWLWKCLEVQKKTDTGDDADAGDEFCMCSPNHFPQLMCSVFACRVRTLLSPQEQGILSIPYVPNPSSCLDQRLTIPV